MHHQVKTRTLPLATTPATSTSFKDRSATQAAFTPVDLLVVLVVLAVLALMLLPALARSRTDTRAFQCLNNQRELARAWQVWSDDNSGTLLMATPTYSGMSYAQTWVSGMLDFSPFNQSNWNPATDIHQSPMWPYCGTNAGVWRCPADSSYVVVNGTPRPRVRSYVMNWYFGDWVSVAPNGNAYVFFRKASDMIALKPAQLLLFLDVRLDGIKGGEFATSMAGYPANPSAYTFLDLPGASHSGAIGFTLADGSGQFHRWRDLRTTPPLSPLSEPSSVPSPNNPDIAWLQDRATRPK